MDNCNSSKTDKKIGSCDFSDAGILHVCEEAIASRYGAYAAKSKIESLRLINGYAFILETNLRCRRLFQKPGGKPSAKAIAVSLDDTWTIIDEAKSGNFEVAIGNSCRIETCHKCYGSKDCGKCDGTGKVACDNCGGSGRNTCSRCGGRGLERCPNCGGKGHVEDIGVRNCHSCHGSGLDQVDLRRGKRQWCFYCHGTGEEEYTITRNCPTCGGDGKITCKRCNGKGNVGECSTCRGTGKVKCSTCAGTGKCPECGGSGRAAYTWWCVQKELTVPSISVAFDNDVKVSNWVKKEVAGKIGKRANDVPPIYENVTSKKQCGPKEAGKIYGDAAVAFADKTDSMSVSSVFDLLKSKQVETSASEVAAKAGKEFSYKIASRQWRIVKVPMLAKCEFSLCGKTGQIYVDAATKEIVGKELSDIDDAVRKAEARSGKRAVAISWDIYIASTIAVIGLPFLWGGFTAAEYLRMVFTPALVAGIVLYLATGWIAFYLHVYVWRLVCRRNGKWYLPKHSYRDPVWAMRILRLMWVLVPMALCQGLYRKVPALAEIASPVVECAASISEREWAYVAAVCAVKLCFVVTANRREWGFLAFRAGINIFAVISLSLAIWPSMLPEGNWLQSASVTAASFIATPLRFLVLVLVWPLEIAFGIVTFITGFVGEGVAGAVIWLIHLFK